MIKYLVGFLTRDGKTDDMVVEVQKQEIVTDETIDLFNQILGKVIVKNIKELLYIDYINEDEEEEF